MTDPTLLEEIKTAYKVHRLRPVRGFFFVHRKRYDFACPIVALALFRGVVNNDDPHSLEMGSTAACEWASGVFGKRWVQGFVDGFDRQTKKGNALEYLEGFGLGATLAQDILPGESVFGP